MRRFGLRENGLALLLLLASLGAEARQAERSLTASGSVARVQASERTITVTLSDGRDAKFVWSNDTKIGGVLAPGAKVTIRYAVDASGRNVAQQISVSR
jgi:Protein of unknown function (DUF1344)